MTDPELIGGEVNRTRHESTVYRRLFNETLQVRFVNLDLLCDVAAVELGFSNVILDHDGERIETLGVAFSYDREHSNITRPRLPEH